MIICLCTGNLCAVSRVDFLEHSVIFSPLNLDLFNFISNNKIHHINKQEGEGNTEEREKETKKSNHVARKLEKRQQGRTLDAHIEEQFGGGRLLACISSRPGQCGRSDGWAQKFLHFFFFFLVFSFVLSYSVSKPICFFYQIHFGRKRTWVLYEEDPKEEGEGCRSLSSLLVIALVFLQLVFVTPA